MNSTLWYVARGSGLVALLMLTVVVALGITTRARRALPGLPRYAIAAIHRNAALLAVSFLTLHVAMLTLDPQAQVRLADLLVPFGAGYRPLWVGFGTIAVDCLVAVVATSLLRHRLGDRTWRTVHWLAYAAWPTAFVHGLGAGSDTGRAWDRLISLGCFAVVAAAVLWRCSESFGEPVARKGSSRPATTVSTAP